VASHLLEKLVLTLSSLPGIGRKSAYRIGFHLLRLEEGKFFEFIENIRSIKESLHFCQECGGITDVQVCEICTSEKRDHTTICIVEKPEDIFFVENTGEYSGLYHVLNGVISPLDGVGPDQLRIKELLSRTVDPVQEVLIATNPTVEGDATASYIYTLLKKSGTLKVTRIAHGVSIGSSIEYVDKYTLGKAIKSRIALPG
jgi:recombination protein RecR